MDDDDDGSGGVGGGGNRYPSLNDRKWKRNRPTTAALTLVNAHIMYIYYIPYIYYTVVFVYEWGLIDYKMYYVGSG